VLAFSAQGKRRGGLSELMRFVGRSRYRGEKAGLVAKKV